MPDMVVTDAEKMRRGGCGRVALEHLGFKADGLALDNDGGAPIQAVLDEIRKQGATVKGPYMPKMTARQFAKRFGLLGAFLVVTVNENGGHIMACTGCQLKNQNGWGNEPVYAAFKITR